MKDADKAAKSYRDTMASLDDQMMKLTSSEKKYTIAKMERENEKALAEANQEVTTYGKQYADAKLKTDESLRERELLKRQGHWNDRDDEMFFNRPEFQEEKVAKLRWEQSQQRIEKLRKEQKKVRDATVFKFAAEEMAGMPIGMGEFAKNDDQISDEKKRREQLEQDQRIPAPLVRERFSLKRKITDLDRQEREMVEQFKRPGSKGGSKIDPFQEQPLLDANRREKQEASDKLKNVEGSIQGFSKTDMKEVIEEAFLGALLSSGFGAPPPMTRMPMMIESNR
jgi:hypothetical protein